MRIRYWSSDVCSSYLSEGIVCGFDSSLSFVLTGRYRWRDTSPKLDHAYTQGHYRKQEHKAEHQCQCIVRKNGVEVARQGFVKQGTIDQQHKHKKQGQASRTGQSQRNAGTLVQSRTDKRRIGQKCG